MPTTHYHPITASPMKQNDAYMEIPPCDALKPYVRCFWGTKGVTNKEEVRMEKAVLVTPDTCMDVIFNVNFTENRSETLFCGINDRSFITDGPYPYAGVCTFAIRFYAWSVILFSSGTMAGALNAYTDADQYFKDLKLHLEAELLCGKTMLERIDLAQRFLLQRLNLSRQNHNVMNAVSSILEHRGNISVSELCGYTAVSRRQMERLFLQTTGVGPKQLAG